MTIKSIRRHSQKDAEAYERYSRDVLRQCKIIKPLLKMTPPDLTSFKPKIFLVHLNLQNILLQRMSSAA